MKTLNTVIVMALYVSAAAGCGVTGGVSTPVGHDVVPRFFHKASLLPDGRVLVTGGLGISIIPLGLTSLSTISIFDPATNTFTHLRTAAEPPVPIELHTGRSSHTQTTLADGRVLITGGNIGAHDRSAGRATDTAELIDPALATVAPLPPMNMPRAFHTATRLTDGRVVVTGGSTWQIFDPSTGTWSEPFAMRHSRSRHAAVLIPATPTHEAERVLLIAGLGTGGRSLEWIEPSTGTSRGVEALLDDHTNDIAAARLDSGCVLIVGGQFNFNLETHAKCYIFDPLDESLRPIEPLPMRGAGIADHELVVVGEHAFVFGGEQQVGDTDTELDYMAVFDGRTEAWVFVGQMKQARDDFAAVLMQDDRVLLIAGAVSLAGNEAPTATAEIIEPRSIVRGDTNGDGRVSRDDVAPFVSILLWPEAADPLTRCAADANGDFVIDQRDVARFAQCLAKESH